jgi:hypothetical protein
MVEGVRRLAGSILAVSASPSDIANAKTHAAPKKSRWIARQPPTARSAAPTVGATMGTVFRAMTT